MERFRKELLWTNGILFGGLILMMIAANLYYGADAASWMGTVPVMALVAVAVAVKMRRIARSGRELDERSEYLTYRSTAVAFYCILAAVLWFYAKEMAVAGDISTRTLVELAAGAAGYIGGSLVFRRVH